MTLSKILCIIVSLFIFLEGLSISIASEQFKKAFAEVPAGVLKFLGLVEAVFGLIILFLLSRSL